MTRKIAIALLALGLLALCGRPLGPAARSTSPTASWTTIAPGMDLASFDIPPPRSSGDDPLIVLRIDPERWEFRLICESEASSRPAASAREWARREGLAVAINAGMYAADGTTHIGFLESDGCANHAPGNAYQSVVAFAPASAGDPPFRIFDIDENDEDPITLDEIRDRYASVVQNLRLIRRPRENRWQPQERAWSEAALGEDGAGRALLIFCRAPFSMHAFNRLLLSLPIDLVAAQHLEGGPQAQLYVRADGFEREWIGGYQSGLLPSDTNDSAWPIPNVLGVVARTD